MYKECPKITEIDQKRQTRGSQADCVRILGESLFEIFNTLIVESLPK
jgi:hypothetical protein